MMPEMDGLSVLEILKSDADLRDIPVIIISALDELNDVARCIQIGAEDYLMKPFEPVLLDARVNACRDRKRLRDQERQKSRDLERANEGLQQFAYVASHDLKEPLRTMGTYAELLERRYAKHLDKEGEQFIRFIMDSARQMREMIDDVLELSQVAATERPPVEEVDLEQVLAQVLEKLQTAVVETGAVVTHGPLPHVAVDPAELAQLLQNLISNAIKYGRPEMSPRISISAAPQEDCWMISVADNGVGIDPEHAEEVTGARCRGQASVWLCAAASPSATAAGSGWKVQEPGRAVSSVSLSRRVDRHRLCY
jgi:signal transduction histidine kinase